MPRPMHMYMFPPMTIPHMLRLAMSKIRSEYHKGAGMDVRGSDWHSIPWQGLVRCHPMSPRPRRVIPRFKPCPEHWPVAPESKPHGQLVSHLNIPTTQCPVCPISTHRNSFELIIRLFRYRRVLFPSPRALSLLLLPNLATYPSKKSPTPAPSDFPLQAPFQVTASWALVLDGVLNELEVLDGQALFHCRGVLG